MKSSEREPIVVIDIGGTNFRSAVFTKDTGLIETLKKTRTPNFLNNPELPIRTLQFLLVDNITSTVEQYRQQYPESHVVGLSFPAPITSDGIVKQASTVWGDKGKNFPLLRVLCHTSPHIDWMLANDITAAAERYAALPQYENVDYFAVITVSSGIGGKIYDVRNKNVILDARGIGGEMGHVRIDFSDTAPICDCGGKGHLGALSSGRAVEKLAIEQAKKFPGLYQKSFLYTFANTPDRINNELLVKAIRAGDKFCLDVLDKTTFYLANAIAHISGNVGADKYILIGGFALNCGEPYLKSLQKNLLKVSFYGRKKEEILQLVELGINDDNDCLLGIGELAYKNYASEE